MHLTSFEKQILRMRQILPPGTPLTSWGHFKNRDANEYRNAALALLEREMVEMEVCSNSFCIHRLTAKGIDFVSKGFFSNLSERVHEGRAWLALWGEIVEVVKWIPWLIAILRLHLGH